MSRKIITTENLKQAHDDVDYDTRKRFSLYILYSLIVDDRYILVQHVHLWDIIDDELRVWMDNDEMLFYDVRTWKKKKKAIKDVNKKIKKLRKKEAA